MSDAVVYWHGGGRIDGDMVLPPEATGVSRSGDSGVHVTTDRLLADVYASTVSGTAWVYEVEPVGEVVPVPSLVGGPTIAYRCESARIIRRFTLSRRYREVCRRSVPAW